MVRNGTADLMGDLLMSLSEGGLAREGRRWSAGRTILMGPGKGVYGVQRSELLIKILRENSAVGLTGE